jgi:hypothetical protein
MTAGRIDAIDTTATASLQGNPAIKEDWSRTPAG